MRQVCPRTFTVIRHLKKKKNTDTQRNIETGKDRDIDTETQGHPDRGMERDYLI